jgi:hypothetical protein
MTTRPSSAVTSTLLLVAGTSLALLTSAAADAVTIDGVRFQDRNAAGRTTLGAFRGSLGVIDYDNDGFMDLVIADVAGRPKRLFHNEPDAGEPGNRALIDRTAGSGLDDADAFARGSGGVAVADINNDGFQDIYIQGPGSDNTSGILYRNNNGNGTFTNISVAAGIRTSGDFADSIAFTDFDHDGNVDLFIANLGGPRAYRLFRNNGNSTFTSQPTLVPALGTGQRFYSHAWGDYDNDGWDDAFMLGSSVPALLRNGPTAGNPAARSFTDVGPISGFTTLGPAPMGIAVGDIDNDGDLDLSITDAVVGTYYENRGGVMVRTTPFTTIFGWGTHWIDADNDGLLDNYQAGSFGRPELSRLHRNLGNGQWANITAALNSTPLASQYSVQVDLNNDGRQDIITLNPNSSVSIYENLSQTGNGWIKIKAVGNASPSGGTINRDAIGARIRLLVNGVWQTRAVQSGSSTTSTEDLRANFGLGAADHADRIEIDWPVTADRGNNGSGRRTSVYPGPIATGSILTLTPVCTGDLNNDRIVNVADLVDFLGGFGRPAPEAGTSDLNADGTADINDLVFLLGAFGRVCP